MCPSLQFSLSSNNGLLSIANVESLSICPITYAFILRIYCCPIRKMKEKDTYKQDIKVSTNAFRAVPFHLLFSCPHSIVFETLLRPDIDTHCHQHVMQMNVLESWHLFTTWL